jgi:thymidylate synthase
MDTKLTFKPINILNALEILQQDLEDKKMSSEIIQDIGEVFIKHMYTKEYENNIESVTENKKASDLLDNEVSVINEEIINSEEDINEEETIINENEMISDLTKKQVNFNEEMEKRKLMKYLSLGWYIYTYCM